MLREQVRDAMAFADGPIDVLIAGAGIGWLAPQLLAWGVRRATVFDPNPARLAEVGALAEASAPGAGRLRLAPELPARGDAAFALVVADGRPEASSLELAALLELAPALAVLTAARLQTRAALREAGAEQVSIVRPPVDAERRFIARELSLLIANRPAGDGEEPGGEQ